MISIYYNLVTGSLSGSAIIIYDNNSSQSYDNITLEITASAYETSGSTFSSTVGDLRVYIKSGSYIQATFPLDSTNIYYTNRVESTGYVKSSNTSSFNINYVFIPDNFNTSSLNSFKIFKSSTPLTSSVFVSSSLSTGFFNATQSITYTSVLSGSGLYYTSSIKIVDQNNQIIASVTGSNQYITASFSSSNYQPITVTAKTQYFSGLQMYWLNSSYIPVPNSSSVDDWNNYFHITASYVSASGNSITLLGGNLEITTSSILFEGPGSLTNLYFYNMRNIISCSVADNLLTYFPNINNIPDLQYFDCSSNEITGSIPTPNSSLKYLNCQGNLLSGSIPNISGSLTYFNCAGNNYLTGSIPNLLNCPDLQSFDCSYNRISGSVNISGSYNLRYFDCSYNRLSGSIIPFNNNNDLNYFDCSNNALTGSIPNMGTLYGIQYFNCSNNRLSGSIPSLSSSYNLQTFHCNNNYLTGSINLSGSSTIVSFICSHNQLSGSINSLEGCTNLQYFNYSYNCLSTDIPRLTNTPNLTDFICSYNGATQDYSFITDILPVTLVNFQAYNANIGKQAAIDGILYGLDTAGSIDGNVNLSGSTNATPSGTGYLYTASLKSKGWTVYTN
jgi:Leucine-rich repeat (LRR) protein